MVYDYIFCGFGLSAIIVLDELIETGMADGKRLLIIEENAVNSNDKTWCFWEEGAGKWDFALAKTWDKALFKNAIDSRDCLIEGMRYKMLDAQKLYAYINLKINDRNIEVRYEKITAVNQLSGAAVVLTDINRYIGCRVFSSIADKMETQNSKHPLLLQHFLGWYIKTNQSPFAADTAILMDFSISQKAATRFMYVLPLSDSEFLAEFTLFSPGLLSDSEYESELRSYLEKSGIGNYTITKKESGVIPMTAFPFWKKNTENILYIGTAGGWTKSSTGYTFNHARAKAKMLIIFLKQDNTDFRRFYQTNRFYWYDRLFVEVLYRRNEIGYKLFSRLFLKSNPSAVLRFLDEKSTIAEELKIILACPKGPFLKALFDIAVGSRSKKGKKY